MDRSFQQTVSWLGLTCHPKPLSVFLQVNKFTLIVCADIGAQVSAARRVVESLRNEATNLEVDYGMSEGLTQSAQQNSWRH